MAKNPYLQKAIKRAEELITLVLKKQVPVRTGTLKNSIKVKGSLSSNGNILFRSDYKQYGVYVDLGTYDFKVTPAERKPFMGYRKNIDPNKKGIMPQFWTSLSQLNRAKVTGILGAALEDYLRFQLRRKR
jgi:hypothetical protein